MTTALMHDTDTYNAITVAAGMLDDTLPMDWQDYAERPDWVIRQVPDYDPLPPEDDGVAPTVVLDGKEVVATFNFESRHMGPAGQLISPEEIATLAQEFDREHGHLAWTEILPRFARIFLDLEVVVHEALGNHWYVSVITPTWAKNVGVEVSPEAMQPGHYEEITGWLEGEAYYLELAIWDPVDEDYVTDDIVGGFYGQVDEQDALAAFGK